MIYIYSKINCGYCLLAKTLCEQQDIDYVDMDIDKTPEFKKQLLDIYPQAKTLPQIFKDKHRIGGYIDFEKYVSDTILKRNENNACGS